MPKITPGKIVNDDQQISKFKAQGHTLAHTHTKTSKHMKLVADDVAYKHTYIQYTSYNNSI